MLNQYEPTVKAAITYLKLLGVKVNNGTVDETLRNHPEWPSLLCLSDSLNKWNIPNGAGEIDKKDINELPVPFIAYTNDIDTPLYIITEVTETTVQIFKQEYNKIITESKEAFMKMWNGVYLITEPNENSGEVNYELNKRTERLNSIIPIATFIALLLFSVLSLERIIGISFMFSVFNTTGVYLQFCISVLGIIVTSLLLWNEIDMNNPVLQKVCGRIRKGNCNAILTSKEAKLFSWLSWSEIGFSYFVGSLLILLFADESVANSIKLLFWINVLALPYTIFSIYYQWQVAKQWCLLCVATQILLILSAVNLMSSGFAFSFPLLSIGFVLKVSFYYLLPVLIWYAVKPYILSLQTAKSIRREYLRIKFNTKINKL